MSVTEKDKEFVLWAGANVCCRLRMLIKATRWRHLLKASTVAGECLHNRPTSDDNTERPCGKC